MGWFENLAVDDLVKWATGLKWALTIFGVLTAVAMVVVLYVEDRISHLEGVEKDAAQQRLQSAESELAATRQRTAVLERQLAPRSIGPEQSEALVAALKPFAGTKFQFTSFQDDQEVTRLVHAMIPPLLAAGWIGVPVSDFLMAQADVGITIEYSALQEERLGAPARALADALNKLDIQARTNTPGYADTMFPDWIKIRVGKKPLPRG